MFNRTRIYKSLSGGVLGGLPGALMIAFANPRVGVAVAAIGAFVGLLLTLPGVSVSRTSKLFVAIMLRRNLPISDSIYDWVDGETSEEPNSTTFSDIFADWILAADVVNRRRWIVLSGLGVGLIAGVGITFYDLTVIEAGGNGLLLPLRHCNDPLLTQAILGTIAISIWTGSLVGIVGAPAFRRPILVGVVLASFLFGLIGYAARIGAGPGPIELAVFFSTGAAAIAILIASFIFPQDINTD